MSLPARPVIGVLHPGVMGAALGSALKPVAGAVIWAAAGRSVTTSKRAEIADLIGVPDLAELARRSHVIVSCCPPHAALDVAREVAAALDGRAAVYVDGNGSDPATIAAMEQLMGAENVVAARVEGPPAWERGTTVLWLTGTAAGTVAALFEGSPFDARVARTSTGQSPER